MTINTNISAQNGARLLADSSQLLSKSLARLSSGSKIVSPADDAAGLAVSTRLDAQINRTQAAVDNIGNAVSFSQTQDGFLQKAGKALDRMSELAMLAQDTTKTNADRKLFNQEFQTLSAYVSDISNKTFNGVSLFSTSATGVTIDSDGVTFAMQAVGSTYVTPKSTITSPALGSTTLGTLLPGMTSPQEIKGTSQSGLPESTKISDILPGMGVEQDLRIGSSQSAFGRNASLFDVAFSIDHFGSILGNGSASYDQSSGEFSITVAPGGRVTDYGSSTLMVDLGFGEMDNTSGSSPMTRTVTLAAPPTTQTSTLTATSTVADLASSIEGMTGQTASYDASTGELTVTVAAGASLKDNTGSTLLDDIGLGDMDNSAGSSAMTKTITLNVTSETSSPDSMDISTLSGAVSALGTMKTSIAQLAKDRATVGANITRLNYTSESLRTLKENLSAATSRIKDVDVAEESTQYARANILVQSGTAMLAQANSMPNSLMRLLS